jgi:hypothetical protein
MRGVLLNKEKIFDKGCLSLAGLGSRALQLVALAVVSVSIAIQEAPCQPDVVQQGASQQALTQDTIAQEGEGPLEAGRSGSVDGARPEIAILDSSVNFAPLSRNAIDYLFDSLRSGSQFNLAPLQQSQAVPNNIVGIWAGVRSSVESNVGVITLRFRPSDEARLAQVESGKSPASLAESFDVELELKQTEFVIRHQLAESKSARAGMVVGLDLVKPNPVLTEFVRGYRDAGMYFAWPPTVRQSAHNSWSLLICPRTPKFVQRRRSEDARLELHQSPYQLREVHFPLTATARARIPPTDRPERISVTVLASDNLPKALQNSDEVTSLSPNIEVPYRPESPFAFIKIPPLSGGIQEGFWAKIETENPAGYIRRQYHSHVVYVQRLQEPSPVPVIVGVNRAARDEGECYVVTVQRSVWNEYDRQQRNAGGSGT